MKKLFSIFCCFLLSASMVTQAQESPIRDADVSATSSQIIADETELLDDGIYVGDVTGPRKAPAATAYAMMKNSTVQYAEIMKLSTTNCYKIIIKVANNYGGAVQTGFVVTSFNTGSNTKIGGNHQFSSSYSNCTESDNWFVQNYSSSTGALYVDNPYGYIQFTYQSMGADGYPIYRIYIHDCYGYTYNNGCINWKSSGAIFSWDNNVSVHPMDANKDRIDFTDYYTISVSSNNNSYGTVSGGGTYAAGAARTLTASVASSSYQFLGWKKNGGSSYVSTSASYNVTVNGNDSYVAEFAPKAAPQYTITTAVSPSNTYGTVTGAGSYYENNPATLTATSANEHLYIFDHWLKDGNNYAGGTTITPTVTANATYTAVFRNAAEGTITGVANYGTISGTGHYTGGSAVTLTVTPNSGYKFAQWSDGNEDNPRTVYVDGDATYTAQFTDLNQPLLASFSWDDDDISVEQYGDGNSLCNSFYAPYGKNFYMLYAKANSRSSKNYLNLSIQSSQSQMWGDLSFFKVGDYPVVGSSLTTNTIQCDGDWYSHAEWFWSLSQTNVCVAYGNDSYALGLNPLGTYLCDKSGSAEDDSDQSNYISVTEGMTCKITVGKNGDPYIRLVRNSDQQCMVSVGEAAVMHTVTINPATNGTITVKDGETTINNGDQVEDGTVLTVTTTPATGYHFDSWTNNGAASVTVNSDVTIGATFATNTYTVTIAAYPKNAGYGTLQKNDETPAAVLTFTDVPHNTAKPANAGTGNQAITFFGNTVTPIPAETANGYTYAFSGWGNASSKITSDREIKANFTRTAIEYTITYNNYDISTYPGTLTTIYTVETPTITLPFAPNVAKEGYTFDGWYANEELTGDPVTTIPAGSTGNKEFWAKWTPNTYTISYKDQGDETYSGDNLASLPDTHTYNAATALVDGEKGGYNFLGWYDNAACTGDALTTIGATAKTADFTLYAKWEVAARTVTITAPTGGTITVTDGTTAITSGSQAYSPDITITLTATPDTDYEFVSWNSGTPDLTNETTEDGVVSGTFTLTDNTTVGATFRRVRYDELTLLDNESADYYNTFADDYDDVDVETVTYSRTFRANTWSTVCLPFYVNEDNLSGAGWLGSVYEFKHAEGTANVDDGLYLNFYPAREMEAGKGYLVYNRGADLTGNFEFIDVTIDTDADTVPTITDLAGYNDGQGTITLVGTLRQGTLTPNATSQMALKDNKVWYPGSGTTTIRAYRGFFKDSSGSPIPPRVHIVVEGEVVTDLEIMENGELRMDNDNVRKYMDNGVLIIERNGIRYDAQGKRIEN